MTDKIAVLAKFRAAIKDLSSTDEPELFNDDDLLRFLKSRNFNLETAEKMLRKTIAWRKSYQPQCVQCDHCRTYPGSHTLRQIGFDQLNRPILYVSFYPAYPCQRGMVTEALTHLIYSIENAIRSMGPSVTQWVFVIDCAGMTSTSCNPRLGYECAHIMSSHYPERLGLAICIRPGGVFRTVYRALKPFLPNTTVSKICLVDNETQLQSTMNRYFSQATSEWILHQYQLNRVKPTRKRYRQFWMPSKNESCDPRGEEKYVEEWIRECHPTGYQAHPNMLDYISGKLDPAAPVNALEEPEDPAGEEEEEFDETSTPGITPTLPSEFKIPANAEQIA